ncbi:hypothetical protein AVEN_137997-1 [Araneus ventricosus]|uniref:Uncharacterized protein n=1 Tax=Araneus ventricosus TaxID=182803 RepID=A0A4Y2KRH8_ARAVE|nr:hypothetical protein AVEN_137997-1 [Araneus ventricosus]
MPSANVCLPYHEKCCLTPCVQVRRIECASGDGKEDVKDEPRSGRPPTSTTPDNIERVRRMLADDRRLSLRMIADKLKISLESVSNIIHEHLQKRKKKVYAFPHYSDPATCDNVASSDTEKRVC